MSDNNVVTRYVALTQLINSGQSAAPNLSYAREMPNCLDPCAEDTTMTKGEPYAPLCAQAHRETSGEVDLIWIALGHAVKFRTDTFKDLSEALARPRPVARAQTRQEGTRTRPGHGDHAAKSNLRYGCQAPGKHLHQLISVGLRTPDNRLSDSTLAHTAPVQQGPHLCLRPIIPISTEEPTPNSR
eukprot:scaffold79778_cov21-Prasinocladus_malaysianus.AAC.1